MILLIGMLEPFFLKDIQPNLFLRVTFSIELSEYRLKKYTFVGKKIQFYVEWMISKRRVNEKIWIFNHMMMKARGIGVQGNEKD